MGSGGWGGGVFTKGHRELEHRRAVLLATRSEQEWLPHRDSHLETFADAHPFCQEEFYLRFQR
jgi:hypothetical protein